MVKKAKITFTNEDGKEIIANVVLEEDNNMELKVDFGKNRSKEHEGLYVLMLKIFVEAFKTIN